MNEPEFLRDIAITNKYLELLKITEDYVKSPFDPDRSKKHFHEISRLPTLKKLLHGDILVNGGQMTRSEFNRLMIDCNPDGGLADWIPDDSSAPKGSSNCGINFKPVSAIQIVSEKPPERIWIWKNFIPQGGLVLLCGAPKAGKSTLAYHLTKAVTSGEPFLGYETQKSAVLILAMEEHIVDVQQRVENVCMTPTNLFVHSGPLKAKSVELEAITECIKRESIGLVIVDTLARFWTVKDENSASDAGANMAPILDLARKTGAAVLLLHHLRKTPGEEGDDIRGSGDVFAIVDAALTFRRRGEAKSQRVLRAFSRYSPPDELVIGLENGIYESLGDAHILRQKEYRSKILEGLTPQPKDAESVSAALDMPAGTVRTLLKQLADSGEIGRIGEGKRGKPFLFYFPVNSAEGSFPIPCGINDPPNAATLNP